MLNCWQVEVSDRPTFAELHTSLDILLTSAQSENYIDLNVDEMLPYYQVSSVQGDEEEMEEKDTHPSNGYHYTTGLNHGYLQGNRETTFKLKRIHHFKLQCQHARCRRERTHHSSNRGL